MSNVIIGQSQVAERTSAVAASADLAQTVARLRERAAFLRMLAGLYYKPLTAEQVDAMDAEAFRDLAETSAVAGDELAAEGYNDMYRFMRRRDTGTRQVLNVDFTGAFYGANTYEGMTAEPYESLYTSPDGRLMGPARADVLRTYRTWGMRVEQGIDLPEDHLTFELEFAAHLNDVAADALDANDRRSAADALEAYAGFVDAHLLNWFNRFFNLSNKLLKTRFYHGVNKVTKAFVTAEPGAVAELRALLAA